MRLPLIHEVTPAPPWPSIGSETFGGSTTPTPDHAGPFCVVLAPIEAVAASRQHGSTASAPFRA